MDSLFVSLVVYCYKPYAPWMLGCYCVAMLMLFFLSPLLSPVGVIIGIGVFIALPVYAALQPRSFFSIRSWDDRRLTIGSDNISWNGITMPVSQVTDMDIYLFSFDDFKHHESLPNGKQVDAMEYGDQNTLEFTFAGKNFDFTFCLPDYDHYQLLCQIISAWKQTGFQFSARSAFEQEYIIREMQFYAQQ